MSALDGIIHISFGGPVHVIAVNGEDILFEKHEYCGPLPCKNNGSERVLSPRHPFWTAVSNWYEQGCRLEGRRAIHDPAPDEDEGVQIIMVGKRTGIEYRPGQRFSPKVEALLAKHGKLPDGYAAHHAAGDSDEHI